MIHPSDNNSPIGRLPNIEAPNIQNRPASAKGSTPASASDSISLAGAAQVREKLESVPVVRPEVVTAAREKIAGPNYPPLEIILRIAETLMSSPDPSEQA